MKTSIASQFLLISAFSLGCPPSTETSSTASTSSGSHETLAPTTGGETTYVSGDCVTSSGGGGECHVECQDCPTGSKCVILEDAGMASSECRPIPVDPKEPGENCVTFGMPGSGEDDCQRGSACVGFPLFSDARCLEFCSLEGKCTNPSTRCVTSANGPLCVPVCDPRLPNNCEKGCRPVDLECPGCFPMTQNGTFSCWYSPPEENGFGFPCPLGECAAQYFCGPPGRVSGCDANTPCCTSYCAVDNPVCPDGMQCEAVFMAGQAPQGLENLGACLTP